MEDDKTKILPKDFAKLLQVGREWFAKCHDPIELHPTKMWKNQCNFLILSGKYA